MNLTLNELKEKFTSQLDELSILELLEITSSDLVEAFSDRIGEKYEYFCSELYFGEEI